MIKGSASIRVRGATLVCVVVAAGDNTVAAEVRPCTLKVAAIAAVAAGEAAAGEEVLGGDVWSLGSIALDADTIGHGLNSAKGPA